MNDCIDEHETDAARSIVDPADIPTSGKFDDSELEVLLYEFKADLNTYLARLGPSSQVHSLKDVIDFNEQYRDREMPYFGQDLFIKAQAKGPLTDKKLSRGARQEPPLSRARRHRLHRWTETSTRCADRANRRPSVAN